MCKNKQLTSLRLQLSLLGKQKTLQKSSILTTGCTAVLSHERPECIRYDVQQSCSKTPSKLVNKFVRSHPIPSWQILWSLRLVAVFE